APPPPLASRFPYTTLFRSRKRVERDREAERTAAQASVVEQLLPILDDLGRAEAHGDLTGAFKAVADKLTSALGNSGLAAFGAERSEEHTSELQSRFDLVCR